MLREVLHAGIVVADLDRAIAEWERLFGVRARDRWESAIGVRVAFFDTPGGRIELVEYTGPIVERFGPVLAWRQGVHHLCFRVDDLEASLVTLAARGLQAVPGFPVDGAHGRVAFLEPEPSTGLIIELCERAQVRRDHAEPRRRD
jgi:methylmalonyl-CoA/ethylmalonyl-CoA epimerase